ncbi:MAG: hypothetical protein CVU38_02470 [Chloroflexi bacterium HGW-Chloroflexi-1]|nr:MAG: hypothetical protein CVU38_02470 [Chloroflexi bacterium HGW-Chloroflexi-1]
MNIRVLRFADLREQRLEQLWLVLACELDHLDQHQIEEIGGGGFIFSINSCKDGSLCAIVWVRQDGGFGILLLINRIRLSKGYHILGSLSLVPPTFTYARRSSRAGISATIEKPAPMSFRTDGYTERQFIKNSDAVQEQVQGLAVARASLWRGPRCGEGLAVARASLWRGA